MESEKSKFILNDEQQAAAYCPGNAVIAAGAGSGKTMVLASRYAWLITEKNYRVREILTLTFTKKAAAQMHRRIHLLLTEIARNDSWNKRRLARRALDEFTQARIQTLDSYCGAVVRQAANRYGINPDFAVDEEGCRQLAIDTTMPFLIGMRNHHAITRFYPHKSPLYIANDIFANALINFTHFDSSPDLKKDLDSQFSVICGEWKNQSGLLYAKTLELAEAYEGNENYHKDLAPVLRQFTSGKIVFPSEDELRGFFNELAAIPHNDVIEWAESHPLQNAIVNILDFFSNIYSLDLRKGSPAKNPVKDKIRELRAMYGEFSSLAVFCMQAGLVSSALALFSELQRDYLYRKRAGGILTYNDIARLAKTILLEQADIRLSEKESFKAIMIDEFQDNNELQKDLLFLLAEKNLKNNNAVPPACDLHPGKLFFVGDEKQSIYRFRGADVSVFRALKQELGAKDLPLKTNYRSTPALIGAFNAIFGGSAFDPQGESPLAENPAVFVSAPSLPPYEASFSPLRAEKRGEGKITLCILDKQDSNEFPKDKTGLSYVENEACYVAERINTLLHEKDETGREKYQPHDIAILFRSRSPQHYFEKHLMLLNIPYANEDLNGFFFGGPVNDLMSVLRLAVYPKDRAAYAQMLRSPFAGLSVSGLAICLASISDKTGHGDSSSGPFGDEPLSFLDEKDRAKYSHGRRICQEIRERACNESVSSLVSALWYDEGYRYETEWHPNTAAYREMYDYLFHLAARADEENKTLASFVDFIQNLDKSGKHLDDIEIPMERPSAVRLITIHKSKGLEFPVVFLCCCHKQGQTDYCDDIFDTTEYGITLTPPLPPPFKNCKDIRRNYFWERSAAVERGKNVAELRRLLYVGMTRAENELYLSGCLGISKESGIEESESISGDSREDFSLQLKQFVDKKTEKADGCNAIVGDTILDGSSFFGLCLPAFAAHIPQGGLNATPSFFTVEKIPSYNEQYTSDAGSLFSNDQKGVYSFLKKADMFYKADTIETPAIFKKYFSPASLHKAAENGVLPGNFSISREYSGDNAIDIFGSVDALLERYAKQSGEDGEKFNSGSFGTIAHICAGAALAGEEASIPPKLAGFLSPQDADAFLEAGTAIALRFSRSPLGLIAKTAENRKTEFPFRSLISVDENEAFINGAIDLVFEDKKMVHIVDFKTDTVEFPGEHIPQMACYYKAAADLFAVPASKECKIWLYYLRSGHAVDVTEQARDYNLGKALGKQGMPILTPYS
ncbi:MAG: UvrD-helicase domain-containing protein [Treponema sp.]|nr:UvrD-helicase domain-containing protein [Treponema sp.]